MAEYACIALDAGARIIGGCCGTSPEHLAAMRAALESHARGARPSIDFVEQRLGEVSALAKGRDVAAAAGARRERRRARE
jgi:5-methyltetrahydrofolate--homocysteine methyltransferase